MGFGFNQLAITTSIVVYWVHNKYDDIYNFMILYSNMYIFGNQLYLNITFHVLEI